MIDLCTRVIYHYVRVKHKRNSYKEIPSSLFSFFESVLVKLNFMLGLTIRQIS